VPAAGCSLPGGGARPDTSLEDPSRAADKILTVLRRLLPALLVLLAALAAAGPASALTIGIGDQKPDMFSDPLFQSTGMRHVRLSVAWDALSSPWQRAELDQWLSAAHAAGAVPLISFDHSRINRRLLPTPERFLYEFRRFRARYPWVTEFATWNEANHCGEPTCHRPRLVASYYRKLRIACPTCKILAAELLDLPNMVAWVREFRHWSKIEPRYWGLHNYIDVNRFRTTGTKALLAATKGQVWLTETGGLVDRRTKVHIQFPQNARHAAQVTQFLFDKVAPLSGRITRLYLYEWNAPPGPQTWDSALINPHGKPRPAFDVLKRELAIQSARRAARLAQH
jgi:hypothetical protein